MSHCAQFVMLSILFFQCAATHIQIHFKSGCDSQRPHVLIEIQQRQAIILVACNVTYLCEHCFCWTLWVCLPNTSAHALIYTNNRLYVYVCVCAVRHANVLFELNNLSVVVVAIVNTFCCVIFPHFCFVVIVFSFTYTHNEKSFNCRGLKSRRSLCGNNWKGINIKYTHTHTHTHSLYLLV